MPHEILLIFLATMAFGHISVILLRLFMPDTIAGVIVLFACIFFVNELSIRR